MWATFDKKNDIYRIVHWKIVGETVNKKPPDKKLLAAF